MRWILLILLLLFGFSIVPMIGQDAPIVHLPEVEVIDSSIFAFSISPSRSFLTTNAISSNHSISSIIQESTHAHVRTYGPGRLATMSQKGASPQQTPIIYKGFNMQNPTLGLTDLSMFSGFLFDRVRTSSTPGSLLGSGVFGNAIFISEDENHSFPIRYQTHFGSLNQWFHGLSISQKSSKSKSTIKGYSDSGKNDFEYKGIAGKTTKLSHAAHNQFGFLAEHTQYLSSKVSLHAFALFAKSNREIPPTRFQARSESKETDLTNKLGIVLTKGTKNGVISFRTAWMDDKVHYVDPLIQIDSKNHGQSLQSIARYARKLGENTEGIIQGEWMLQNGKSTSHIVKAQRTQYALFSALKKSTFDDHLTSVISGRLQSDNFAGLEFLPHFDFKVKLGTFTHLFFQSQRIFRLPSLDDLFWEPGGNPDLLPESGWHQEFGMQQQFRTKNIKSNLVITGYYRSVKNWILWRPLNNQIWSPENIAHVQSRGIEFSHDFIYQFHNRTVQTRILYTLQRATEKHKEESFQNRNGKQLIYMPLHQLKINLSYVFGPWMMGMHHRLVSKSFSDPLNESIILPFQISSISIGNSFKINNTSLEIGLKIENLWNEEYEIISNYPLPGRMIHLQLNLKM